jgi:hypothetical protein
MENESSAVRLRKKFTELSNEYSKEKQVHPRSRSANSRGPAPDPNASLRYRRMRRKVFIKSSTISKTKVFRRLMFFAHRSMQLYMIIILQQQS